MKSVISVPVTAETNAIDSAIATVDNEVSDLSTLVTAETNAIDSAPTVDNEVSDLSALVAENQRD